jgi:hypothetical protein
MSSRFALRLVSGAQAGESIQIERSGVLIGRRPGNDLVLKDASVSGRHALVRLEGEQVVVEDLGSTNGTRVDGQKVERAEVTPGSSLKLGNIELELLVEGAAAAPEAPAAPVAPAAPPAADGGFELELEDEISLEDPDDVQLPAASPAPRPVEDAPDMPTLAPSKPLPSETQPAASMPAATPAAAPSAGAKPAPKPKGPSQAEIDAALAAEDGAALEVDLDAIERTRSGSKLGAILVGGLLLAAGGAAGWLYFGPGAEDTADEAPTVAAIPDNRIGADFSFEVPYEEWTFSDAEGTSQSFDAARDYATSGRLGVGVELLAGGRATMLSEAFSVRPGQALEGRAQGLGSGQATARLGLLLESSKDDAPALWLLGPTTSGQAEDDDAVDLDVLGSVPLGYDRVRLALLAAGPGGDVEGEPVGSAGFDDVVLLIEGAAAPPLPSGDHGFEGFGSSLDATQWTLSRAGRALAQLQVQRGTRRTAPCATLALEAAGAAGRLTARASGLEGDATLRIWLTPRLWEASENAIATLAGGQFEVQGASFQRDGVDELLLGSDLDRIGLRFAQPVSLSARPERGGVQLAVSLGDQREFGLQLSFEQESTSAVQLAGVARMQTGDGQRGAALETWGRLLSDFPYATDLAAEAQTSIGQLEGEGLKRLGEVELGLERAEFFGLAGMFEEAYGQAAAIAADYGGADGNANAVTERAAELMETASRALARLGAEAGLVRLSQRGAIAEYFTRRENAAMADLVNKANVDSLLEDR